MMFWYGGGWAFWEVAVMWIGMIAFWGLLIWAVYALVTKASKPGQSHSGDDPRRILDQRLARGEIDADEHQRLLDVINSGHPGTSASTEGHR